MGKKGASATPSERVNVWLVDDDERYCNLVVRSLNESKTVCCERQFHDLDNLVAAVQGKCRQPEVILLDIRLRGINSLDSSSRIKEVVPSKIVVLTAFDSDSYVFKAFARWAQGFFLKDTSAKEITQAVVEIARGGVAVDQRILSKLVKFIQHRASPNMKGVAGPGDVNTAGGDTRRLQSADSIAGSISLSDKEYSLTETEKEIIRIAIKGGGQKEMGDQLNRSVHTVHTHLKNIFWRALGYFVNTTGIDEETIRKYVKYQEKEENREERQQGSFRFFRSAICFGSRRLWRR